ncbi:MAG: 16S rRNA (guanine(527)-N(7))-methyltransferase RsmG [Deltaproteobacteria bacterium]|nr:16S rRNA (guanine(527)-N(7))-methyltransferase RsmG [Deltaproteobacteria bacterium]
MSETLGKEKFTQLFRNCLSEIEIEEKNTDNFWLYIKLLLKWNRKINLFSASFEDLIKYQLCESLLLFKVIKDKGKLLDVGSGAGFPGLAAKIYEPDMHVTLVESNGKKAVFLRSVCATLKLSCDIKNERFEKMKFDSLYNYVSLRAVSIDSFILKKIKEICNGYFFHFTTLSSPPLDELNLACRVPFHHHVLNAYKL